jgi:hypothetical protein
LAAEHPTLNRCEDEWNRKSHRGHPWTTSDEEWEALLRLIPGTPLGMCSTSIRRRTDHSRLPDFNGIVSWLAEGGLEKWWWDTRNPAGVL